MRVWGVTGWKNSGKTGLMERLVAAFSARGHTIATIKHAHHGFDVDQPGRDSHRHRAAGAQEVLVASNTRWALIHELRGAEEPRLEDLLAQLSPADLVLVEGYKHGDHPKIACHRAETGQPPFAVGEGGVRAIASDTGQTDLAKRHFHLDDTEAIVAFVSRELGL
ncbi:MAG: molybdopterin-guanine dinucleotide biosynthesis protein B [Pseudomonadota bacterium]